VPSLVEKWEIPGDGTEIILTVRQGVKWHNRPPTNGRELVAEDIAFNTMRIAGKVDPQNVARYQRRTTLMYLNTAQAVDKYTLKVTLDRPNGGFIRGYMDWRNSIVAREQAEQGFQDPLKFVGTGPFTIDRWEDNGQRAEFRRNPDYWKKEGANQLPYIDSIRWNYLPDRATSLAAFIDKKIDWIYSPSKAEIQTISSAFKEAKLEVARFADWWYLRPNNKVKPFDDPRVRKAIFLAIDYKDLNDTFYGPGLWDFAGPLAPSHLGAVQPAELAKMPGWNPDTKKQDIERAKALMAEAGYSDPNFSLKILQLSSQPTGYYFETSIRIKDQFSKIWPNLKVEVELPPDGATFARRLAQADFEMVLYGAFPVPDAVTELFTHYHTTGGRNYTKYSNPEIDSKLEAAFAELNEEKRAALIKDIQMKLINDEVPLIGLIERRATHFVNPRIKGFSGLPGPGSFSAYDPSIFAERYWLEA